MSRNRRDHGRINSFRGPRRWAGRQYHASPQGKPASSFLAIMVGLPLAAFTATFVWGGAPVGLAAGLVASVPSGGDHEIARFSRCDGPVRYTCVVDGDTFWYHGEKVRIADINTPETSEPQCPREAELGEQATARLVQLLNKGPFSMEQIDRETDRYGRKLRLVMRNGVSLGSTLEAEGLAEHWQGRRRNWC